MSNGKTCAGCGRELSRQKQHTDAATRQSYCESCWQKRAAKPAGASGSAAGKSRAAATAVLPAEAAPEPTPDPTPEYEPAGEAMPRARVPYPVTAPPKWVLVAAAAWAVVVVVAVVVVLAVRGGSRPGRETVARRAAPEASMASAPAADAGRTARSQPAAGGAAAAAPASQPTPPRALAGVGAPKSSLVAAAPSPATNAPSPGATAAARASAAPPSQSNQLVSKVAATAPSAEPDEAQVGTVDLLAAAALPAAAVHGDWKLDGTVLSSSSGTAKDRAKLRFAPPPADAEYDYSVTFTATGQHPYVVQVLSFKGRPFSWMMLPKDSAFGLIRGKAIKGNPSAVKKGITAGTKHTSVVKVRNDGVSSFVDGAQVAEWRGGYGDLSLASGWDLGPTRPLGIGTECPITIESATLTVYPAGAAGATDLDRLARLISNPWSNEPATVDAAPSGLQPEKVRAQIDRRAASTQPAVASAARRLKEGLSSAGAAAAAPAGAAPAAGGGDERFLDVLLDASNRAAADAPAVRRDDPADVPPPPLPSSGSQPPAPVAHASAAPLPILGAPALAPLVGGTDAAPRGRAAAEWRAERARLGAWDDLLSHAADLYPKAAPDKGVVKLQLTPPDASTPRGAVAVINTSNHPLTHVTLRLELTHYLTAPAPTARQFYFIPQWQPGQTIYLSATCVPNLQPESSTAAATMPRLRMTGGLRDDPWLGGAGGLLAATVELWSTEAHQPAQTVRFEQNVEPCAKRELAAASHAFGEVIRRSMPRGSAILPPSRLALPETDPLLQSARAAAQRAADLLPATSPLAADAKALLKDPVAVARQEWKQQLDPLVAALPVNKIRQGTWTLRPAEKGGPRESGKVTLAIDSRSAGGEDIVAALTAPDQPNVHQRLIGRVELDPDQNRLLIHLRNPAIQPAGRAAPDYKLPAGWTNLYLVLKDQKLVGAVRCGPGTTGPVLDVTFSAPEEKPANKPKAVAERAGSLTTVRPPAPKPAAPRPTERRIKPAR